MKNVLSLPLITAILFYFCASFAHAGLLFTYHDLALKDLDVMNKLVTDKLKESKKSSSGKVVPLKEGLQAVYSRPDEDRMIAKVVAPLRNALDDMNEKDRVIEALIEEAINAMNQPKNFKADFQVTYWVFLENIIADLKSSFTYDEAKKDGFEEKMLKKIANAKIKVSKAAEQERYRRIMKTSASPSETAEKVLDSLKK